MCLCFCSFSSGSSGNSYLVRSKTTALLIDAGISGKRIVEGLSRTETPFEMVAGILITHEHIDHVRSLKTLMKRFPGMRAYANGGTWSALVGTVPEDRKEFFVTGEGFFIGDIFVKPFSISHDAAEPVGYSLHSGGKQIAIVTDTGFLPDSVMNEVKNSDLLVLEANHEEGMLQYCSYPYSVKQRILGERGHLSNLAAAEGLCRIWEAREVAGGEGEKGSMRVLLAHLSRENNDPALAQLSFKNILAESDIYVGQNVLLDIILRDQLSAVYEL